MTFSRDALGGRVIRRALLLAALVGGPVAVLTLALYARDLAAERRLHERDALSLVDLVADAMARETMLVQSDLLLLLQEPLLADPDTASAADRAELERKLVAFARVKRSYDRIRVLDRAGRAVVGVDYRLGRPTTVAAADLRGEKNEDDFRMAMSLDRDEVYVSDLDLSRKYGRVERPLKPVIRFAAPTFDAAGRHSGVLVLHYLGKRLLRAVDEASVGYPGSLLLLREEGSYLRASNPDYEWGQALGHGRVFADDHPRAWSEITRDYRGQFVQRDGLFTFRAARLGRKPGAKILIVSHVPRQVLRAGTDRWRGRALAAALIGGPALLAAAWYVSYSMHVRRENERRLAQSEGRLRRLSRELLDSQERERTAVSRDLHDDLGQLVTLVALDLERAKQGASGNPADSIERALDGTRRVLERLHEIAFRIRPRLLDELGLREAAQSLLAEFEESTGVEVASRLELNATRLPRTVAENAFRILQEGLNNVYKHARTSRVEVELLAAGHELVLRIVDHGSGFDAEQRVEGLGLLGMRERVELLGGSFSVRSRPGAGTTLEARLPLESTGERES